MAQASLELLELSSNFDEPHKLQYDWEHGQLVTVTIEPTADGSHLTLEHRGLPDDDMKQIVTEGWTEAMQQIETVLS